MLFDNHCANCGKFIPTYALNKQGDLPVVFCSSPCETKYNDKKKYDKRFSGEIVDVLPHKMSTEELTARVADIHWTNS